MQNTINIQDEEYQSGETVEPGLYLDVDTGALVQVRERDELPEGSRIVRYRRRFRRVEGDAARATAAPR